MTDAAITFLLENIKQLVAQKLDVLANAEGVLKRLRNELETMKSFLEDHAYKKAKSKSFQTWESQIRGVVHKAEDLIDEYVSNAYLKKGLAKNTKKINLAESVTELLVEIHTVFHKAQMEIPKIETPEDINPEAKKAGNRLRQHGFQIDKTTVGFEDDIEKLIGNLKEPSSEVEAISIIGMGGLGKTTVASKIFNNPDIEYAFPVRIWITVSESYNARDIYMTIIKHFTKEDVPRLLENELALRARHHLKDVVFLLVVDDVWTLEAWKDIKLALPLPSQSALPSDEITSKVLLTSRYTNVATCANPRREHYPLRFLTYGESWKLLQLEVYGKENVWPKDLEKIGSSIAKRCNGLPLSLVVMGGILLGKLSNSNTSETKREWEKISRKADEHLLKGQNEQESMDYIISLSYDKLPYEYRDCFLYLGVLPEDYEISAWKLTRLWVAEGFIRNDNNKDLSMEEVAEDNLNEFIKRNLVMVDKKNTRGEVKRIRVHDVIRHFCKNEAKKLDLFQEISFPPNQRVFVPILSDISEFRRICLHSAVPEFFKRKPPTTNARSFICFSKEDIKVPQNSLSEVFDQFRLIRVFEGSNIKFPRFAPGLVQLIHLRYLTLSAEESFKLLPESICSLWCLETLVIITSSKRLDVKNILKLKRLRHVKIKAAMVLEVKEKSIEINEYLQTLTRLSTKSCTSEVLDRTPNLKTLGIRGDLDSILDTTCLENLKLLLKLKLKNDADIKTQLYRVPKSEFFPPTLKSLTLEATNLEWAHMDKLALLMKLENLKLKDNAFSGETWSFESGGFDSLECLHIDSLECLHIERSNLKDWTVSDNSFRELKYLIIKVCKKLEKVPSGLAVKLKTLDLEHVSNEAVISAVKIWKLGPSLKLNIAPGDMKAAGIKK